MRAICALALLLLTGGAMAEEMDKRLYSLLKYTERVKVSDRFDCQTCEPGETISAYVLASWSGGLETPDDLEEPRQMVRHFRESGDASEFGERMRAHYSQRYEAVITNLKLSKGEAKRR